MKIYLVFLLLDWRDVTKLMSRVIYRYWLDRVYWVWSITIMYIPILFETITMLPPTNHMLIKTTSKIQSWNIKTRNNIISRVYKWWPLQITYLQYYIVHVSLNVLNDNLHLLFLLFLQYLVMNLVIFCVKTRGNCLL